MRTVYASFDEVPSFKGASTHILGGLCEVVKQHEVDLITLGAHRIPSRHGLRHRPVDIRETNYFARGREFRRQIEQWLASQSVDLIHFRTPWEGLAAVRTGAPCIYEINGVPSIELKYHYPKISPRILALFREWEEECVTRAHTLIVPSVRTREFVMATYGVDSSKVIVFANAREQVANAGQIEKRPPAADRPLRGVYLGTLSSWQGVHWGLKAFAKQGDRFTLDIYSPGAGKVRRRLEHRIKLFGLQNHVTLHPALPMARLRERLPTYDFAWAPLLDTPRNSVQGCNPIKNLDYLSAGLPVIGSDLEVNRASIEHGVTGLLFAPNVLASLRSTLEDLWCSRDQLEHSSQSCINQAQAIWTWPQYSRKLAELYATIPRLLPSSASALAPA